MWETKDVLLRVKEQRNILHEIRKRKANWIGHILRRNCLLQRVTEGKVQGGIEMTGRQGRRRRKLLDDLRKGEDTLIWKRKLWIALCGELALEEALDLSYDRLLNEWEVVLGSQVIQGVPLATEPGISLIILTPMMILQRNLSRSTFVLLEMKRNVSVVCVCFVAIFSLVGSEWDTLYKISKY